MAKTEKVDGSPLGELKEMGKSDCKDFSSEIFADRKESTDIQWPEMKVFKNLMLVSITFLLLFVAYDGVSILQSTMNSTKGVGVASQAIIYAFFCIFALFLPKYVIRRFGCKTTLTLSMLAYCPYIAANFYPHWATLIPSAVLLGFSASTLWAAKCTYLNELSFLQSLHGKDNIESITSRVFGVSATFFMSSFVWCNLVSYYVLEKDYVDIVLPQGNETQFSCGSNFSAEEEGDNPYLHEPTNERRYFLSAAFLACGLFSVILNGLLLDSLPKDMGQSEEPVALSLDVFMSTITVMKRVDQLLLLPVVAFSGNLEAFYLSDFTKGYVACAWGVHHVGYVTISYGVMCSISSSICGFLVRHTGRIPIYLVAGATSIAFLALLFKWTPNSSEPAMFFVMSGMCGFIVGVTSAQVRALYGILFSEDEEAAFANYYLWHSLGSCASFSYSNYLNMTTKVCIVCGLFIIAVVGYVTLEIKIILFKRSYKVDVS